MVLREPCSTWHSPTVASRPSVSAARRSIVCASSAAANSASRRAGMGVVPAWPARPVTRTSSQRMAWPPVTTPISTPLASSTGPCSIWISKKASKSRASGVSPAAPTVARLSPRVTPSASARASASASGIAPVNADEPSIAGVKRAPSSLVQLAISSGARVVMSCSLRVRTASSAASTPSTPSKRPPAAGCRGGCRGPPAARLRPRAAGELVADGVVVDGQPGRLGPLPEQRAPGGVRFGQRQPAAAAVGGGADLGHGHQAVPQTWAVGCEHLDSRCGADIARIAVSGRPPGARPAAIPFPCLNLATGRQDQSKHVILS